MAVSTYRSASVGSGPLTPPGGAGEASKNAERLFETQSILEIHEVAT